MCVRIHHNPLIVAGSMVSCNITEECLRCDMAVLLGKNVCNARIVRRLDMFIEEEDSIHLRMALIIIAGIVRI